MSTPSNSSSLFKNFKVLVSLAIFVYSVIVLLGWFYGIHEFVSVNPHWPSIHPLTAVDFLLLSSGTLLLTISERSAERKLLWSLPARLELLMVVLIASLVLFDNILKGGVSFDSAVFSKLLQSIHTDRAPHAASATSILFILSALRILIPGKNSFLKNLALVLSLSTLLVGTLILVAYGFRASVFFDISGMIDISLQTAIVFVVFHLSLILQDAGENIPLLDLKKWWLYLDRKEDQSLYFGAIFTFVLLFTAAVLASESLHNLLSTVTMQVSTQETAHLLDSLLYNISSSETSQRGYILTDNENYLAPYAECKNRYNQILPLLQHELQDQPEMLALLARLRVVADQKYAEMDETLRLRRETGFQSALKEILTDKGKHLMDEIQARASEIQARQDDLLQQHRGSTQSQAELTILSLALVSLLATIFLIFCLNTYIKNTLKRQEAERLLRKKEALFQSLFESAPDAIISLDANGRLQQINSRTEALFQHPRKELIGEKLDLLVPGGFQENKESAELLTQGQKKSGELFPVSISLGPLDWTDEKMTLAVIHDITDQKKAEDEILQLNSSLAKKIQELELLNKEMESFSYTVSHDLRAPLRTLSGFSHILMEDYEARLDERGKNYFNRIVAAADRMSKLIDGLLSLSRISRREIRRVDLDISSMALQYLTELQAENPLRKVEILVAPNMKIWADSSLMEVALQNLLGNAWKFTSHNELTKIEFNCFTQDGDTIYFIKDNGAGFDMAYANKLFGTFQRLHGENEFPGTGIGLATVQRIVRLHGGEIWANGKVGEGAVFYFKFPRKEQFS